MKTSTLFFTLFLLPFLSFAQSLNLDWGDRAGGDTLDIGYSVVTDASGNVYTAGYFGDTAEFDPSGTSDSLTSAGGNDIFLVKYDSSGNYQWGIDMGGPGHDRALSLILDGNGNPVLTGDFEGTADFDPSGSSATLSASGGKDIFLAKYDPSGNYQWAGKIGGADEESGFALALDQNGDIFLTGHFKGTTDFDPSGSTATLTSAGDFDAYLAKYDDAGNYILADRMGGTEWDQGISVSTDGNGSVYITGNFKGTAGFDPTGVDSLTSGGDFDVFFAKYDLSNTLSWSRRMGGPGNDRGRSIAANGNGNIAITGYFQDSFDFYTSGSGGVVDSEGGDDAFFVKYWGSGNPMAGSNIGGSGQDWGMDVAFDSKGNVHLTGKFEDTAYFRSWGTSDSLIATGSDVFLAKYGPYGTFGRATGLGGGSIDWGTSLFLDNNRTVHLTGLFVNSIDLDPSSNSNSLSSAGFGDFFLGRYQTPPCTTEATVSTTAPSCAGSDDGMATANVNGGTTPYSYAWSTGDLGDTTATVDSLSAGYYLLSVRDSAGCIDTSIFEVEAPPALSVSLSGQDATCKGISDGEVTASPSGGITPYSYQWSNGDTTATIDSLPAGTYSVTVTDSNGCQTSASYSVDTTTSLSLSTSVTNTDCGTNNGSASVMNVSGGSSPYSYLWSSGDTTATADSLYAGTYTVQVTDANGCEAYASVNVNNDSGLTASLNNVTHVSCPGDSSGAIDISVSGGTSPYSYQWNNGASTQDLSGIPAGYYEVEVLDADSCKGIVNVEVTEPSPLSLNTSSVDASCGSSDGEASVSVSGGTTPYSYQWSSGGNSATETGLGAGSYTVTVTDSNGCVDSATASVSETGGPTVSIDNISTTGCGSSDGGIFVSVSGGSTPYDFLWSNGDTTEDLTGVGPGSYSLTVEDSAGCKAVIDTSIETVVPQVSICVVSVDSNSEHNLVVWEELSDPSIKEYNVYKETYQAGVYSQIGTVQDSALTTFVDTNSDPKVQSERYKISSVDSCGNESPLSPSHKTIHLTANEGVNNNVNLIWDFYEGFSYPSFYIHRYTDSTGWEKIDSLASTNNSYTDANAPDKPSLEYVVSVDLPSGGCTATRAKSYNNSISNAGSISSGGGGNNDSTSIARNKANEERTKLYPNPTNGHFTLEWKELEPRNIEVYDIYGQKLRSISIPSTGKNPRGKLSLDLSDREPGVYWIRVEGQGELVKRPVVVK